MSDKRTGRASALFDDAAFVEDLNRASEAGRVIALAARKDYEQDGIPTEQLLACEDEGPEGTALANCVKVRLPHPDGKFGMVFRIERRAGKLLLAYAAFGVRHHPRQANALSVYEVAHRRLSS
jgi:hypothetical protein